MTNAAPISTERPGVTLERMSTDADYEAWLLANRETPNDLLPTDADAPDHEAFRQQGALRQTHPDWVDLAILEGGQIRGIASLYPSEEHVNAAELTYTIAPRDRNRGYGSLAVAGALDYAIKERGYAGAFAEVNSDNSVSQHMLANAGFTLAETHPGYVTLTLGSVESVE